MHSLQTVARLLQHLRKTEGGTSGAGAQECWHRRGGRWPAWQDRHICALRKLARCVLARKHAHSVRCGPQEGNALALQRLHKVHILAEKSVARVAGLASARTASLYLPRHLLLRRVQGQERCDERTGEASQPRHAGMWVLIHHLLNLPVQWACHHRACSAQRICGSCADNSGHPGPWSYHAGRTLLTGLRLAALQCWCTPGWTAPGRPSPRLPVHAGTGHPALCTPSLVSGQARGMSAPPSWQSPPDWLSAPWPCLHHAMQALSNRRLPCTNKKSIIPVTHCVKSPTLRVHCIVGRAKFGVLMWGLVLGLKPLDMTAASRASCTSFSGGVSREQSTFSGTSLGHARKWAWSPDHCLHAAAILSSTSRPTIWLYHET